MASDLWYHEGIVLKLIFAILLVSPFMSLAHATEDLWKGKLSFYTPVMEKVEASWPIQGLYLLNEQKEPLKIQAITTEGNDYFIGVAQMMTIKAPLAQVMAFLDHYENYPQYFDGLKKAEILETKKEKDRNWLRIFFEQTIPIPFVPNDRNEMVYSVKASDPSHVVYRYQFRDGNDLISNDGMILLDALSTRLTRYVEFDFFDAHWGIAKTFGAKKIWARSMRGLVQSDYAIKLKVENPGWDPKKVLNESKEFSESYPAEDRYLSRVESKQWFKAHGTDLSK